jgi:hypothetical protein
MNASKVQLSGAQTIQGGKAMVATGEVMEYIKGIDLPQDKKGLISYVQSRNAPQEVLDILNKLPEQQFGNAADITHAISQVE